MQYRDFMRRIAAPYRKYFEPDDLAVIAQGGFICAWRGWRKAYWQFEEYAVYVIREELEEAKTSYSRNLNVESKLSLDKKLPSGNGTYENCFPAKEDDLTDIQYLVELFGKLGKYHRRVLELYSEDYYDDQIMHMLNISHEDLQAIKKQIALRWMDYDPSIRERYKNA